MNNDMRLFALGAFLTTFGTLSAMGNNYSISVGKVEDGNAMVTIECNDNKVDTTMQDLIRIASSDAHNIPGLNDFSVQMCDHTKDADFSGLIDYSTCVKIEGPGLSLGLDKEGCVYLGSNIKWQNQYALDKHSFGNITVSAPNRVYLTFGGSGLNCNSLNVTGSDINFWPGRIPGFMGSPKCNIEDLILTAERSIGINSAIKAKSICLRGIDPFVHIERPAVLNADKVSILSDEKKWSNCCVDGNIESSALQIRGFNAIQFSKDYQTGSWKSSVKTDWLTCDGDKVIFVGNLNIKNGADIKVSNESNYEVNHYLLNGDGVNHMTVTYDN